MDDPTPPAVPSPDAPTDDRERRFVLQVVQPGLAGLMDGSVSTLAPLFAAAFATRDNDQTFRIGLAAAVGAGISMAFAEAMHNVAHLLPMSPASDLTAEANSGVVRGDGTVLVTGAPVAAAPNAVSYCEVRRRSWTASLWHGVAHGCGRGVLCIVEPGARGAAPTTIVTAHRRHSL